MNGLVAGAGPCERIVESECPVERRTGGDNGADGDGHELGSAELSDLWWNAELALSGAFTMTDGNGSIRVSIERIVRRVDDNRLQLPPSRFPSYKVVDLADWLEVG